MPLRWLLAIGLLLAAAGALFAHRSYGRWSHRQAVAALFGDRHPGEGRALALRLSYVAADRYRPHQPSPSSAAGQAGRGQRLDRGAMARLERAADLPGLIAAHVLSGDQQRAATLLDELAPTADVLSDRAVLWSREPGQLPRALEAVEGALALRPDHPQALWNRGLLLDQLGLPLAGARALRRAAALGEPGWSAEAGERAVALERQWQERLNSYARADLDAERIKAGAAPSPQTLTNYPDLARLAFLVAVREAGSPARSQALRAVAGTLDRSWGTSTLAPLVRQPAMLREMVRQRREGTVAAAEAYGRLAAGTGDAWLRVRADQTLGQALTREGRLDEAVDAYTRVLDACRKAFYPYVCIETKVWLAYLHNNRRQIQAAKRWGLEAKKESQSWSIPLLEANANAQLAVAEDLREQLHLARAYAEEAAAQSLDCGSANTGRELLAKIALAEGDHAAARRALEGVVACQPAGPRFGMIGAEALASLSDPAQGWGAARGWLSEAVAQYRRQPALPRKDLLGLDLFAARAALPHAREAARRELRRVLAESEQLARADQTVEMVHIEALSALVVDAAMTGEAEAALALLGQAYGVDPLGSCLLGTAVDGGRGVYVARSATGRVASARAALTAGERQRQQFPVPPELAAELAGCPQVEVIATAPVLGSSRLLPPNLPWSYRRGGGGSPPLRKPLHRLVVFDARPPAALGLGRLPAVPDIGGGEDGTVEVLRGRAATPGAALARAVDADVIEWHVHGIVDAEVSDAAALALSADPDGRALLTASDILRLSLPRRPGIVLGACRAGLSARYGAYQWSLPLAFLSAGARWVLASPTPIEDAEAPEFFAGVWRRIVRGAHPAVALRDERMSGRWRQSFNHWTEDVVLFN
jgi:cellulose synthase operon protein C